MICYPHTTYSFVGNATCSFNRLQSEGNPFGNVAQLSFWHSPNPSMQPLLQRKYPAINENNVWLGYQTNVFVVWYSLICLVLFGVLGCSGMFFFVCFVIVSTTCSTTKQQKQNFWENIWLEAQTMIIFWFYISCFLFPLVFKLQTTHSP